MAQSYPALCNPMDCSTPGLPLKLISIDSVMPSNHVILCHLLLLLPSVFPRIRVFSSQSALPIRWPKYWSFSFSISPSKEYSGLISFKIDWFDLLIVQGTLKSLLQHHSFRGTIYFYTEGIVGISGEPAVSRQVLPRRFSLQTLLAHHI